MRRFFRKKASFYRLVPGAPADAGLLGGKGANLVRLIRAGFPVPGGMVLAPGLAGSGDGEAIRRALQEGLIGFPADARFAVRSSAADEDGADLSFAGQHDTILNVSGLDGLAAAVTACAESVDAAGAQLYRERMAGGRDAAMAVVVQQMVDPVCAGVLFTRHPVRPDVDRIVVEAVPGLGESLVSGTAHPDRWTLYRDGREERFEAGDGEASGVRRVGGEAFAALSKRLEKVFGGPQDAEWAFDGEALFLLQARPVTALPSPDEAWTRTWGDEFWAEATTPLQFTFLGRWILDQYFDELGRINGWDFLGDVEPLRRINSHVYFNAAYAKGLISMIPKSFRHEPFFFWLPPAWRAELPSLSGRTGKLVRNLALSKFKDRRSGIFSHHKKLPRYTRKVRQKVGARLADDLATLSDRALWDRLVTDDALGREHFRFIRWGLATYLMATKLALAWMTEHWTPELSRDRFFLENLVAGRTRNQTLAVNEALSGLAREAAKNPALMERARTGAPLAFRELAFLPGGREFCERLDAFIKEHGHRGSSRELHHPRWRDDPGLVLGMVLAEALALAQGGNGTRPEPKDPGPGFLRAAGRGPGGLAKRLLAGKTLSLARIYTAYRENQRYALDYILADLRSVVLEMGARLHARGSLSRPEEVFFLNFPEFRDLWQGRGGPPADLARRAADFEKEKDTLPPEWILDGRPWPGEAGVEPSREGGFSGTGASPGRARGAARVVRTPGELARVRKGDILVAPNTDPGWTPVFAIAGAVVVETGGMLSHAAIVAREYGIPAVTGVHGATRRIADGETLVVDGDAGRVVREEAG